MTGHNTSFVEIRDDRLQVMRGGAGASLVVLHGGGGGDTWLPYMDRLAQRFDVTMPHEMVEVNQAAIAAEVLPYFRDHSPVAVKSNAAE